MNNKIPKGDIDDSQVTPSAAPSAASLLAWP